MPTFYTGAVSANGSALWCYGHTAHGARAGGEAARAGEAAGAWMAATSPPEEKTARAAVDHRVIHPLSMVEHMTGADPTSRNLHDDPHRVRGIPSGTADWSVTSSGNSVERAKGDLGVARGEEASGLSGRLQGDTDARMWGASQTIALDMAAHAAWHAAAAGG